MPAKPLPVGAVFGRLKVIGPAPSHVGSGPKKKKHMRSFCRCKCGNETIVWNTCLRSGHTGSCGCQKIRTKHGHCGHASSKATPEYNTWKAIRERCYNPNRKGWGNYGGRGIKVCARWRDSFPAFLQDAGPKPTGQTIERIDNDGHYSCGHCEECVANGWLKNCRWATYTEQARNKRTSRIFSIHGVTGCVTALALHFGIPEDVARGRLRSGWCPEDIFTRPVQKKTHSSIECQSPGH